MTKTTADARADWPAASWDAVRASGGAAATPGPSAARSQDFLYDEDGLPG